MIPRQWLVSCHRKRASAEAYQSVSNPHAMPPMLPWRRPLWGWRRRPWQRIGRQQFGRQRIYAAVPWRAFPTLGVVLSKPAPRAAQPGTGSSGKRRALHGASGGGARSAPDHPSSWLAVEFPTTHPSCPSPSAGAPRVLPPTLPPTLPTLPPIPTAPPSAAIRRVRIVPSRGGLGAFSGWRT